MRKLVRWGFGGARESWLINVVSVVIGSWFDIILMLAAKMVVV